VRSAKVVNGEVQAVYRGKPEEQHRVLAALVQAGFQVQSFTDQEMDLETLYMRVTKGIVS
jgi:hypothetical protein